VDSHSKGSNWIFEEEGEKPVFRLLTRNQQAEHGIRSEIEEQLGITFSKGESRVSFELLRDQILEKLHSLPPMVKIHFSPEFAQLSLKKARFRFDVFEKIDYFNIEGSLDWDDGEMDFMMLRSRFHLENGWLRLDDRYIPLDREDEIFLQQMMMLSDGKDRISIPKNAAVAMKENKSEIFSRHWHKVTSVLSSASGEETLNPAQYSPVFSLREYQQKGLDWFVQLSRNMFGGILADDMGLGKTFQAAAFLRYLREKDPAACGLIVVPSTLIFNWQQELKRFSPDFRVYIHSGPNRSQDLRQIIGYYQTIIVSYQTLLRDSSIFSQLSFACMIADEAQHLKNPGTAAYKAVKNIQSNHIFLLTGTPLQNSPADLWALSEICNPGLLSQKIKPGSLQKNENPKRFQENLKLMQALVKPFMLRRTKESVLSELPEKTVSVVHCSMTEEQEMEYLAYNQLVSGELHDLVSLKSRGRNVRILKALTALRLMASHPVLMDEEYSGQSGKFELVKEKMEEVLAEGRKVLVFSSFVRHLELLAAHLRTEGKDFAMLTGQTADRKQQVEKFQQDANCQIFLISLKAGGFGLNLVEASCVFLLDPWWNPAAEAQAMDRVHRIGQKDRVTVYKFITANTVEEKILKLQEQKSAMNDQLFEEHDGAAVSGPLSIETLQSILLTKV
jgi:SNF2 family DNA or RNA helicase